MAPGENDHRPCIVEHVGKQSIRQRAVEKNHGTAGFKDAEMTGHGSPIVLRHGDSHHLVGTGKEARNRCGNSLCARIEFGEGE